MSKKGEAFFHNNAISTFNGPVLFGSIWAREAMGNAMCAEEVGDIAEFATPIGLKTFYVTMKLCVYHFSKLNKRR